MKKIILLLIFIISLSNAADSQNYFPLKIGNKFVYFYQWSRYTPIGGGSGSRMLSMKITDTITINGKKYFNCTGIPDIVQGWVRVDSITGSLYKYTSSNNCPFYYYETLIDSLGMISPGWQNNCSSMYYQGTTADTLFGTSSYAIHFSRINVLDHAGNLSGETHRYYNKIFGFKYYHHTYQSTSTGITDILTLRGCCINGICYGDTTGISIGINVLSSEVPTDFILSQNYPNPFNPETKIRFSIPKTENGIQEIPSREGWQTKSDGVGHVRLTVYDALGREVETLVNEALQPGTYEVTFNGSGFNSGVYFYRLVTNGYTETKRMLMIK